MIPTIAITMGDPAGVGPEVIAGMFAGIKEEIGFNPIVIGDVAVLREIVVHLGLKLEVVAVDDANNGFEQGVLPVMSVPGIERESFQMGSVNRWCGDISYRAVVMAVDLVQQGVLDALVTAPISKEAWHIAGHNFDGHTGLLGELTGCSNYRMTFASEPLNVMLTTTHIPLCRVCSSLSVQRVRETIEMAHRFVLDLGTENPRIAVCGVNPHAGESGIFGTEEDQLVTPAVKACKEAGINVFGPIPADTVFLRASRGEFDLVIAHYHDQGLIPVKLLAFDSAVNISVGLPIIRTSVDHGTAFDIAGQGKADSGNLCKAVEYAVRLVNVRSRRELT